MHYHYPSLNLMAVLLALVFSGHTHDDRVTLCHHFLHVVRQCQRIVVLLL